MEETLIPSLPTLPIFLSLFIFIYVLGHFLLFRSWSPSHRSEASSCLISIVHGTPAFLLSLIAVAYGGDSAASSFAGVNTSFQNTVMNYSVAYFSTDLIHFMIFSPKDFVFILHHMTTLFGFLTCQYVAGHGAFAILVLLAMAESTSLVQNAWTLAGLKKEGTAEKVYRRITMPFCVLYTAVRGVVAPCFAYRMGMAYLRGEVEGAIPRWVWSCWMVLVLFFIPVSLLWISGVWIEAFRNKVKKIV